MEFVVLVLAFAAVVWLIGGPLRPGRTRRRAALESAEQADLEAAKEAKLREIRDLELDWRTGKLSDADYRAQDRTLRAEAIVLLKRIDTLQGD